MLKKETMYSVIFAVYGLNRKGDTVEERKKVKQDKETYRKLIRRRFEKLFPGKSWDDLSQSEKDVFVYVDIKEDILERYVGDKHKKETITRKIDEKLKTILNERLLVEHNRKKYNKFRTDYYKPEDSDTPKRKAYDKFCEDLTDINCHVPIPSYNEWIQWNEKAISESGTPLRIYDCLNDFYYNSGLENTQVKNNVSQAEVDHVVVEILKNIIEEEWGIEINIPKIRECLTFVKNNEFDEYEEIPDEYNSFLETEKNISKEEQERYIAEKTKYYMYMEMLKNLDFVIKKETADGE